MGVRCIVELLLFQLLVAWCSAKHVTIGADITGDLHSDVQGSLRNLIHTGIYSHKHLDPAQAQVVTPVKVSRDGELISHEVDHAHGHGHARARRDLHMLDHDMPHELHYNLTVDGRNIRLDLRPSVTFITPALVVERHGEKERSRSSPFHAATACHYTGSIRGQEGSSVALSACDGLAGLLRTRHGEYWIEPSKTPHTDSSAPRPHVIFKRSAVDKVAAYHRAKREAEESHRSSNNPTEENHSNAKLQNDARRERALKEDKRRREYLDYRRKRMKSIRNNPIEYRMRHPIRLRMEQRRAHSFGRSSSKSNSVEGSLSLEQQRKAHNRNRNRNKDGSRSVRMRKRRRRSNKNCGTKQPPYQWKTKNHLSDEMGMRKHRNNKNRRNQQTHRKDFENRRSTRSVSKPRHVEVLLVADQSMTTFHNETNLETYLLTIMNIVSSLYMDPSIGNYIKVVVVKIILLEEVNASDLDVTTNADETLTSFCKWQQQLNPDDDDNPHHHDVAILITRQDICSQHYTPCSTLGVAHVAGMCKPDRSCSVNEDNGIMLAHTITHELGHNFGLYHDTEKIGCHRRDGATLHIMTPVFETDTVQVAWSRCSKRDVTNFLDAGLGECLNDKPSQEEYTYPEVPAGVTFDAETQCHLQFGSDAVVCADPAELCEKLWCSVNNTCKTMLRAAAPGTTCGTDMWCQNQTCVGRRPSPAARDGGWGAWSPWSECSRTCGAGVSTQSRNCDSPPPDNNGAYCIGDRSRYKICNTEPCPINEPTFREVQCAKYNNITYNNETISDWIPYFDQDKPCELHCVPRNDNDVELIDRGFVADGTPCRQSIGSRDMCIAGVCYKVGCDWIVNSDVEEDECGVCGGSGAACKTVQGIYTKDTTKKTEFSLVATIPAGSRNVKIQEKASPGNFLSIRSASTKKMYLNGAQNAMLSEYFVAGSQAIYERDRDWEKLRISGPIADDITIYQRIKSGKLRNPGVTYQYTVDRQRQWRLSPWGPCSVTCGDGYTTRQYDCYNHNGEKVDQSECYHMESPGHEAMMQHCRMPPCVAYNQPLHTAQTHEQSHNQQTPSEQQKHREQQLHNQHPHNKQQSYDQQTHSEQLHNQHSHSQQSYNQQTHSEQTHNQQAHSEQSHNQHPHSQQSHNQHLNSQQLHNQQQTHSEDQTRTRNRSYSDKTHKAVTSGQQHDGYHSEHHSVHHSESGPYIAAMSRPPAHIAHVVTSRTHWWVGQWKPCDKPCHMPGEEATKKRNVYCVDKVTNKQIPDYECDMATRPINRIKCAHVPAC